MGRWEIMSLAIFAGVIRITPGTIGLVIRITPTGVIRITFLGLSVFF